MTEGIKRKEKRTHGPYVPTGDVDKKEEPAKPMPQGNKGWRWLSVAAHALCVWRSALTKIFIPQ